MCLAECWHLQGFVRLEVAQMPSKTLTTPLGVSVQKKCKWMYIWSGGMKTWNFETFWKDVCVLKTHWFCTNSRGPFLLGNLCSFYPTSWGKAITETDGGVIGNKLKRLHFGWRSSWRIPGWQRGHLPSKNPMFNQFLSQRTGRKCVLYQRPVVVTWPSVMQKWRTPAYSYLDPVLLILGQHPSISYSFSKRKHSISDGDAHPTS